MSENLSHTGVLRRLTLRDLQKKRTAGERLAMLTAYDCVTAALIDRAGIDLLLVGDSLGNVVLGHENTIPVTMDDMIRHTAAVVRGTRRALVVLDLPFGTTTDPETALRAAVRAFQETGCQAVKLEGTAGQAEVIACIVSAGIPVVGHVGLRPQAVHQLGGYRMQRDHDALLVDARAAADAGACAIVLECVPREAAQAVTAAVGVPTIGIGAGPDCDGQVLVMHDLVGLSLDRVPRFVRSYADVKTTIRDAISGWRRDVERRTFPGPGETLG